MRRNKRTFISLMTFVAMLTSILSAAHVSAETYATYTEPTDYTVGTGDSQRTYFNNAVDLSTTSLQKIQESAIKGSVATGIYPEAIWPKLASYAAFYQFHQNTTDKKYGYQNVLNQYYNNVYKHFTSDSFFEGTSIPSGVTGGTYNDTYAYRTFYKDGVYSLNHADTIADALASTEGWILDNYKTIGVETVSAGEEKKFVKHFDPTGTVLDGQTNVFYVACGNWVQEPNNVLFSNDGAYQADLVLFYNFRMVPLFPGLIKPDQEQVQMVPVAGSRQATLGSVKNESLTEQSYSQDLAVSEDNTVTTSLSKTQTFTFGQSFTLGVTAEAGFLGNGGEISTELGFTAEQSFELATSTEHSATTSVSRTTSTNIVLPPYTQAILMQDFGKKEATITYNYPMAIMYDVAFVHYGYSYDYASLTPNSALTASFSANGAKGFTDANNAVYQRVNDPTLEENNLNWNYTPLVEYFATDINNKTYPKLTSINTNVKTYAKYLQARVPMIKDKAKSVFSSDGFETSIKGIYPLMDLKIIEPVNTDPYSLTTGDTLNLNDINIKGYNSSHIDYYGFDPFYGKWILCDDTGAEIGDTGNDVASVAVDSVTGYRRLVAGSKDGSVYLKYQISSDKYRTISSILSGGVSAYLTPSDITKTAMVKVNVKGASDTTFNGTLTVSGSLEMFDDETVNLNTLPSGTIKAEVRDALGAYINVPLTWYGLDDRVAKVDKNVLTPVDANSTVTKSLQVRFSYKGIYSDPVTVTIKPHPVFYRLSLNNDNGVVNDYVFNDGENKLDLNKILMNATDQYDKAWADFDPTANTWAVTLNGSPVTIGTGDILEATTPGNYMISVTNGKVTSNVLSWKVLPARTLSDIHIEGDLTKLMVGDTASLAGLTVYGIDQYSSDYPVKSADGTWTSTNASGVVTGDVLKGMDGGTGTVYLTVVNTAGNKITSNRLDFKVTKPAPIPDFTSLTADKVTVLYTGGVQNITLKGTNLPNGVTITAYDSQGLPVIGMSGTTKGDANTQSALISFPANLGKNAVTYTLKASYSGEFTGAPSVLVTVNPKSKSSGAVASASVTPTSATFSRSKSTTGPEFVINPNGYDLVDVKYGKLSLVKGKDYIVDGNKVTIAPTYLKSLTTKSISLLFDMSGGTDPKVNISITN